MYTEVIHFEYYKQEEWVSTYTCVVSEFEIHELVCSILSYKWHGTWSWMRWQNIKLKVGKNWKNNVVIASFQFISLNLGFLTVLCCPGKSHKSYMLVLCYIALFLRTTRVNTNPDMSPLSDWGIYAAGLIFNIFIYRL